MSQQSPVTRKSLCTIRRLREQLPPRGGTHVRRLCRARRPGTGIPAPWADGQPRSQSILHQSQERMLLAEELSSQSFRDGRSTNASNTTARAGRHVFSRPPDARQWWSFSMLPPPQDVDTNRSAFRSSYYALCRHSRLARPPPLFKSRPLNQSGYCTNSASTSTSSGNMTLASPAEPRCSNELPKVSDRPRPTFKPRPLNQNRTGGFGPSSFGL
jgi:hypothetical protein